MRLATLRDGTRDGCLVVVRPDGVAFARATGIAGSLQAALDDWERTSPKLRALADAVSKGDAPTEPIQPDALLAPLPRAYEWIDGSAYLNHVRLVRQARGAAPPETLETDPLIYQGGSGVLSAPTEPIALADEAWGLDFESEVAVILGDTPQGISRGQAASHVRLVVLVNDVSLRNLIPAELAKGFGFFQSKPASAFAPFACTPDELGASWREGRAHVRVRSTLNGKQVGDCDAGPEMHFSFFDLMAHIAKTRSYTAGTVLGSGTVSNAERARGISCLAEQRMIETIESGAPQTPFMKIGDTIRIEAFNSEGRNLFGTIDQRVVPFPK
ncbi:MAG: fumarylacetoacetate hydrolase family protein [Myxococcaceae bacterium]